jgi:hypothetical protein
LSRFGEKMWVFDGENRGENGICSLPKTRKSFVFSASLLFYTSLPHSPRLAGAKDLLPTGFSGVSFLRPLEKNPGVRNDAIERASLGARGKSRFLTRASRVFGMASQDLSC